MHEPNTASRRRTTPQQVNPQLGNSEYKIENGIPIPSPIKNAPRKSAFEHSELSNVMRSMQIGQSVLLEEEPEYHYARGLFSSLRPNKYSIRKIPRLGWRIWRIS